MLLDETPASLLRHTLTNFSTAPDRAAITRINESLSTIADSRSYRLSESEKALRILSRRLATTSQQHREAVDGHDSARHGAEIVDLDSKKFRVAKVAQELEVEGERLEGELGRLRAQLERLEAEGVEGGRKMKEAREGDDPVVLRLWLYRNLGIHLEQDVSNSSTDPTSANTNLSSGIAGTYHKATISNKQKGDVHVINIEPGKFSKYFYADYFWSHIQG